LKLLVIVFIVLLFIIIHKLLFMVEIPLVKCGIVCYVLKLFIIINKNIIYLLLFINVFLVLKIPLIKMWNCCQKLQTHMK
jgi:hypothetical protein